MNQKPYLHGVRTARTVPLQDHLPPYQAGVVQAWLSATLPAGGQILCPFGSSPQTALEAARSGYQVVVPIHNPLLRFLIENLANPPTREELNGALVSLASSYKGKERLKPFILSLYETDCPKCGAKTPAVAFQWSKSSQELISKTCRCSSCGEESTGDVSVEDLQKASQFSDRSPTYARALTRVTSPTDPIRFQVEKALSSYPPRSVYALFTVLNKLTGFDLPPGQTRHLQILLLNAFYRSSRTLDLISSPDQDEGDPDGTYQETNVWFAMQDALEIWPGKEPPLLVTHWPELPPENGGICIFPGRVKDLISNLDKNQVQGIVIVLPRPTPTFWSLSALWTGWLWGQEAAAPLRGVLSVQSYDWPWMTRAVESTLADLIEALANQTPVLSLIPDASLPALVSGASASLCAGLKLENLALDPDHGLIQTQWHLPGNDPLPAAPPDTRAVIRQAGFDLLREAGEPQPSLTVYGAGFSHLAQQGFPGEGDLGSAEEVFSRLQVEFEENIAYRQGFLHFPELHNWWHLELDPDPLPRSDQIEKTLVTVLLKNGGSLPEQQIYQEIYHRYPALATPRSGLIQHCLESYAHLSPEKPGTWVLKPNDQPANRIQDLQEMETILNKLAGDLGFRSSRVSGPENIPHVMWQEGDSTVADFYISVSALLSKILFAPESPDQRAWMILPGSRAELIHYKLSNHPLLMEKIAQNWGMIKFRHLRRISQQGDLKRGNYLERFQLDPFTTDSPQLLLI